MSTTYDGVASYPKSITITDDGDAEDAASVNVAIEALADRTTWLRDLVSELPALNWARRPRRHGRCD